MGAKFLIRTKLAWFAAVMALVCAGCHNDDGMTEAQQKTGERLAQIIKSSGGKWDNISQADRDYIITNVAHGNERAARMIVAGPPGATGGRNAGGPPAQ